MRLKFQYRRYRLPLRVPVRTAHGVWTTREGVVVRLENEGGAAGLGEAAPIPEFGTETVDEVEAACRIMGEWVDDDRFADFLAAGAEVSAAGSRPPGPPACLRNALSSARAALTGAPPTWARRSAGVVAPVPAGEAAPGVVAKKAESGFRTFKWKVGVGHLGDEIALLDDVCAALPPGAKLRLDANGAWDRRAAERWLERCAERPVEFVEQPAFVPAAEGEARRRRTEDLLLGLANDFPTPIALDESLVGDGDVNRWLQVGWPGIFVIKPSLLGDPGAVLASLGKAEADIVFSSALETAVGARAALSLALAWGGGTRALGFGVWPLFADARFDGPAAAPFLRAEDVERIDVEAVWNALI